MDYTDIAKAAWPLFAEINKRSPALTIQTAEDYLGKYLAPLVAGHFNGFDLSKVNIATLAAKSLVPTPKLDDLERKLGLTACAPAPRHFPPVTAVPAPAACQLENNCNFGKHNPDCTLTGCTLTHAHVFDVLCAFTNPADLKYIVGITYNGVIYLTDGVKDNLPITVHELVHARQWAKKGPEDFLASYICGWAEHWEQAPIGHAYGKNPAETNAYKYQTLLFTQLPSAAKGPDVAKWRAGTATPSGSDKTAVETAFKPGVIDEGAAIVNMP